MKGGCLRWNDEIGNYTVAAWKVEKISDNLVPKEHSRAN